MLRCSPGLTAVGVINFPPEFSEAKVLPLSIEAITERETMLGIHEHLTFTDATTTIGPGEAALLFTDGLHSLLDHNGERMEVAAVQSAFGNIQKDGNILEDLSSGLKALSNEGPFLDDVAAISIQRCG